MSESGLVKSSIPYFEYIKFNLSVGFFLLLLQATQFLAPQTIKCSENSFRDVAVGAEEFNEFKNKDSEWKDPNGDKLILGVINQVCTFEQTKDTA